MSTRTRTAIVTSQDIKVRDFAFEKHGVKPARVVSEVDVLKYRYTKERASYHVPSQDLINKLSYFDPDWLSDAQKKSDAYFVIELKESWKGRISPSKIFSRIGLRAVLADTNILIVSITIPFHFLEYIFIQTLDQEAITSYL